MKTKILRSYKCVFKSPNFQSLSTFFKMIVVGDFFSIPNRVCRLFGFELIDLISGSMKKSHRIKTFIIMGIGIISSAFFSLLVCIPIVDSAKSKDDFFNNTTFNMVIIGGNFYIFFIMKNQFLLDYSINLRCRCNFFDVCKINHNFHQ